MVKLYVGNVPNTARASDLRALFEKYGMVTECDVIKNYAFIVSTTDTMWTVYCYIPFKKNNVSLLS